MVSESNDNGGLSGLVFGAGKAPLLSATAFGSSMLPLMRLGAELWLEMVSTESIDVGDVVLFYRPSEVLVAHRVVRVLRNGPVSSFLTQGDNRLTPDTGITHSQILGRVVRVGKTDIRSFPWRVLGRIVASLSYGHFLIWRRLTGSSLNHLRHRLEKKGILPRINAGWWFENFVNPIAWLKRFVLTGARLNVLFLRNRLLYRKIYIQRSGIPDIPAMVRVWNEVFPECVITDVQFTQAVDVKSLLPSPGFFLVKQGDRLLGWVLVHVAPIGNSGKGSYGCIDLFILSKEGWRSQACRVLFHDVFAWFCQQGVKRVEFGFHLAVDPRNGISLAPFFDAASEFRFGIVQEKSEFFAADFYARLGFQEKCSSLVLLQAKKN